MSIYLQMFACMKKHPSSGNQPRPFNAATWLVAQSSHQSALCFLGAKAQLTVYRKASDKRRLTQNAHILLEGDFANTKSVHLIEKPH